MPSEELRKIFKNILNNFLWKVCGQAGRNCFRLLKNYFLWFSIPTYLPTFLPTYLPTYLPSYLPTYLQTTETEVGVKLIDIVKKFLGGSPGLVVMGGDSCSEGSGFESQRCILDGHVFTLIYYKFVLMLFWKDWKWTKKRPGMAHLKKVVSGRPHTNGRK